MCRMRVERRDAEGKGREQTGSKEKRDTGKSHEGERGRRGIEDGS